MAEDARIEEAADAIRMGDLLVEQGRLDPALAVYRTGLDLNRAPGAGYRERATHWREQSVCYDRMAAP